MLFDGRSKEQKILDAKTLLEENGYVVRGPLLDKSEISTIPGLVSFFYSQMTKYNPESLMLYSGSKERDMAIAKRFIDSRQSQGMSKERAYLESIIIIETLFQYESSFELKYKITSMNVLDQEWIVEKAVDLINGFNKYVEETRQKDWFDNLYSAQEKKVPKEIVELANKRLGIGIDNGKKED